MQAPTQLEAGMLMVLMALIELGRSRVHAATRWLWLLLSGGLFVGPVSCASATGDDASGKADAAEVVGPADDVPQVLYGPPPADIDVADDVPQVEDCQNMAYYGPQPCETDQECVDREGPGWYCNQEHAYDAGCGKTVSWPLCEKGGVLPDAIGPDAVAPDVPAVDVPTDTPVPNDCGVLVTYGPPPCTSDAECQQYGDWYCDQSATITDGCGNVVPRPTCAECSPPPQPAYGPPPCSTDADCAAWESGGVQYYCDLTNVLVDNCGKEIPNPMCTACEPMNIYGPPPCTTDEECVADHGAGWYCDKTATGPEICTTPAQCKQK